GGWGRGGGRGEGGWGRGTESVPPPPLPATLMAVKDEVVKGEVLTAVPPSRTSNWVGSPATRRRAMTSLAASPRTLSVVPSSVAVTAGAIRSSSCSGGGVSRRRGKGERRRACAGFDLRFTSLFHQEGVMGSSPLMRQCHE